MSAAKGLYGQVRAAMLLAVLAVILGLGVWLVDQASIFVPALVCVAGVCLIYGVWRKQQADEASGNV